MSLAELWCIQFNASRLPFMGNVIQVLEGGVDITIHFHSRLAQLCSVLSLTKLFDLCFGGLNDKSCKYSH